ncbi:DUF3888 domain-containing protein [Solibacillus sp. FSL W7-1436]|uniref:DUF3888 domain-containing protein n=1 Tax=unclassified Solibacillus TaxID=2637870 RepID=UPI0030FB48BF
MRKLFLLVPLTMLILIMDIQAQENLPTSTPPTRENIMEDAVIDLLQPQMYSAVEKHYGTTNEIGFMCLRVVEIKKLDHSGSWLFEVKLDGLTYTGTHNPLDIFTVTVKKDESTLGKWSLQDYNVRKFDSNEKTECRIPA